MSAFATVDDIVTLWRPLTDDEMTRADALLPVVSDALRQKAVAVGKDLDQMVAASETLANVARMVTVDIVARVLRQSTTGDAMTQESQSGLGYSWSGTFAVPGGGITGSIMYTDLKALGLLRQQIGAVQVWQGYTE